jgi:hypothetical protein
MFSPFSSQGNFVSVDNDDVHVNPMQNLSFIHQNMSPLLALPFFDMFFLVDSVDLNSGRLHKPIQIGGSRWRFRENGFLLLSSASKVVMIKVICQIVMSSHLEIILFILIYLSSL